MRPAIVFLDDGGVLSDNTRRAAEWHRLVGEFLPPRLGGDAAAWGDANRGVFERAWQRFEDWGRTRPAGEYLDFFDQDHERERWLRDMCERVGVAALPADQCAALARETEAYVLPRVRAAYPGAAAAVRALHGRGFTLATASGGTSRELHGYLIGMGVREHFGARLYGPDLVRELKDGPEYYRRMFAHAGVDPAAALVVDDTANAVRWATEAGATAVLVSREGVAVAEAYAVIGSLADLPALLD